jgi:hypothetical protein
MIALGAVLEPFHQERPVDRQVEVPVPDEVIGDPTVRLVGQHAWKSNVLTVFAGPAAALCDATDAPTSSASRTTFVEPGTETV